MKKEQKDRFDEFMSLFNTLEGYLRKIYRPIENKSIMLMYINDIPEPYASKMNTIRCARNVYVHGVKFDEEPLIQINDEVLTFLRGRIADVKARIEKLTSDKPIEERREHLSDSEKYELKERFLSANESINRIVEVYSWYGWEYMGTEGLDDLESKPMMKFRRDTTKKSYKVLRSLWEQRIDKFDEYDRVREAREKEGKPIKKGIKLLFFVAGVCLMAGLFAIASMLIITAIKSGIGVVIAIIGVSVLLVVAMLGLAKLFNRNKRRVENKDGKIIHKNESELAQEINVLDTQAKNIWEYLK